MLYKKGEILLIELQGAITTDKAIILLLDNVMFTSSCLKAKCIYTNNDRVFHRYYMDIKSVDALTAMFKKEIKITNLGNNLEAIKTLYGAK